MSNLFSLGVLNVKQQSMNDIKIINIYGKTKFMVLLFYVRKTEDLGQKQTGLNPQMNFNDFKMILRFILHFHSEYHYLE